MKVIPDLAARMIALTAVDRTLLVEAGAGSGKTSVMAGRVAVLFAGGVEPKHIAAITFTEFAASELRFRIERFTTALSRGEVHRDLKQAFPVGVPEAQKANVYRACETFDQLTCSTIHGFAQALIKPYPAEAGIDPGANIVDPTEADLAFKERYDAWLKERLSGDGGDGLIAQLILASESAGLKLVEEVAQFLPKNRDAACAQVAVDGQHHFTRNDKPSLPAYSEMVSADRDLRLAGYEIFRFGANELVGSGSQALTERFFDRLFQLHGVGSAATPLDRRETPR